MATQMYDVLTYGECGMHLSMYVCMLASLSYSGTQLWDSLPIRIRNSSKTEFLQYIMENSMAGGC